MNRFARLFRSVSIATFLTTVLMLLVLPGGAAAGVTILRIDSLTPSAGPCGTRVRIEGTGFGASRGASTVNFGAAVCGPLDYVSWSDNLIEAKVPTTADRGVQQVHVTVLVPSNEVPFTVIDAYPTWYLAEGTTAWGFSTYISIQNPNTEEVTAKVTYMTDGGAVDGGAFVLPAESQTTVNPAETLGEKDFSTRVACEDATKTICVDRTMRWPGGGGGRGQQEEGHCSVGVTGAAETWYLPEGSSAWGFECWLLIQNPNVDEAHCTVTYMIEGSGPVEIDKTVPGNSRATYNMTTDIGERDASIKVEADVPVIPERAMYRDVRRAGHDSIGTTAPATSYFLSEGTTAWGFTTYVLIQNPNDEAVDVTVTYMTNEGPVPHPENPIDMPGRSRKTIRVNDFLQSRDFSTRVTSDEPIIAERAMYWDNGTGEACHDSIGTSTSHVANYLPDGETSRGRETWTLVQNPNAGPVTVEIRYMTPTGEGDKTIVDTITGNSRKTYNMSDQIPDGRASIMVLCNTEGSGVICERAMYWNSRGAGTDTVGGFADSTIPATAAGR